MAKNYRMKKLLIALLLVLGNNAYLHAQDNTEITGSVYDAITLEPLEFASVALYRDIYQVNGTITDANGSFSFKPLDPGVYKLAISFVGYGVQWFENIQVRSGSMVFMDCALQAGMMIDTVIHIYANKLVDSDRPEEVKTYKPADFKKMAVDDIKDVVRNAPKVYENEQTGGLSIAGARETSTLYVVDNVKVIGSFYIPLNAIAEINVYTGGIPANYGDFTGGVVEIKTKGYTGVY